MVLKEDIGWKEGKRFCSDIHKGKPELGLVRFGIAQGNFHVRIGNFWFVTKGRVWYEGEGEVKVGESCTSHDKEEKICFVCRNMEAEKNRVM